MPIRMIQLICSICVCCVIGCAQHSRIMGIRLVHFPRINHDNKLWDHKVFGGDGDADIFIVLSTGNKIVFKGIAYQDVGQNQLPILWNMDVTIERDQLYEISVWDEDVLTHELMGKVAFLGRDITTSLSTPEGIQLEFVFE